MSLYISSPPTQGGVTIKWSTILLEDSTLAGLQAKVDLATGFVEDQTPNPRSFKWLADIQYQIVNAGGNMIIYSVMVVIGEWNPS